MDGKGIDFDPKDEWHEYEMQWTPNTIRWFLDGNLVRTQSDTFSVTDQNKD